MSGCAPYSPVTGVGVLVWRERRLLLGQRRLANGGFCWQFPGGHLEKGETVSACAEREVLEETGLRVRGLRHLGFTDSVFTVNGRDYLTLLLSCDYLSGEADVREPEKCAAWQWFDYPRLPSPLFEPIEIFMKQPADLYRLHCAAKLLAGKPSDERK